MEAAKKLSRPVMMPERIGLAEDKRNDWVATLPHGVTLAEAMDPSYWAPVADTFTPLDHIELRAEDGSEVHFLIVRYSERNYAYVHLDRTVKLVVDQEAPVSSINHKVEWKGPHLQYAVIRTSDSKMLQSGMRKKDDAIAWMTQHEKTLRQ